jgi:hypothetical protein
MDAYLARFQNLPPWNVHQLIDGGRNTVPWYEVNPTDLIPELVLNELDLANQVMSVTAQIQKWGRLEALAKRVWEVAERRYRCWRAQKWLDLTEAGSKKLTEANFEAIYRSAPEYEVFQIELERAEEAHTATHHTVEAWRAKRAMLEKFAVRYRDGAAPQLSV